MQGLPTRMLCPAQGFPKPAIKWYKDGLELTGNELSITINDDGSLEIPIAQVTWSIKYLLVVDIGYPSMCQLIGNLLEPTRLLDLACIDAVQGIEYIQERKLLQRNLSKQSFFCGC